MPNLLKDLKITEVALCPEGVCSEAHIQLYKSKQTKGDQEMADFAEIMKAMKPEFATVIQAEIEKAKAEVPAEVATELETLRKAKPADPTPTEEEILKSLDPNVRAILEKSRLQAEMATAALKKAQEEQETAEAIAKAKEVEHVPAKPEEVADLYKSLKAVKAELAEQVFGIFKAMSAVETDGGEALFKGKGAAGDPGAAAATSEEVWTQVEAKAAEIAKAEDISQAEAISKAFKQDPELYKAYVKSMR